ncbi:hypothetical protein ACT3CE_02040 [Marinifilum sp. RC60d5]|uniref:hypothetical protein n=1 Tax=Marinifilum sp. RC60d5 TaxID=3458414 RepID=UPI0040357046
MFKWKKLGRIFNPTNVKNVYWINEFAQAPSVLIFKDFIRIYFSSRPKPNNKKQYLSYTGFLDLNKNNLFDIINIASHPILPLGHKGSFDEFGIYPTSVIQNNDEIIAYYAGWTRCESVPFNVAIGMAKSTNGGKTFTKIGNGPVLSYSLNEPFVLSGPKIRRFNNQWYLFYIAGCKWIPNKGKPEPVYKIRMARSADGINWIKENRDLIENKIEENEAQASPDVFFYDNKYHMFFCYRNSLNFRGKNGGYRIGYASSNDLLHWTRNDNKAGITISEQGWDSEMIAYPHVFELDEKIYMLYLGNSVGKYGFGIAELEEYSK